jgi:hypothetical protein
MSSFDHPVRLAKVTGTYRWREGARFDHAYYESAHARLTTQLLAPLGLVRFEQQALAQVGAELAADLPNYTNIRPSLHVSEVLAHAR